MHEENDMSEGHHTEEQVDKAFAAVPKLLRKLIEAGCENPWVELHGDASGKIILGRNEYVTDKQIELAIDLVKSRRYSSDDGYIGITSCCGFVSFAEDNA